VKGATSGILTAYLSGITEFKSVLLDGVHVARSWVFWIVFYLPLFELELVESGVKHHKPKPKPIFFSEHKAFIL
jgi:hypothetical protein